MESKNELPEELKGWSWGPFLLNWIWAISNKTWWGLFAAVPYLGFFVALYLGFKGRELAWKNNDWESFEQFDAVQKKWSFWGAWLIGGLFIAGTLLAVALPALHKPTNTRTTAPTMQSAAQEDKFATPSVTEQAAIKSESSIPSSTLAEEKELLLKQGVGGNQDLSDVKNWGTDQLMARSYYGDNLIRAQAFAAMWQRQIIHKLEIPPERSLFLGYSIVLVYIDKDTALCRPDMSKEDNVFDVGKGIQVKPECFKKT